MNGKNGGEISKNSKKADTNHFEHVVSEGSVVVLDALKIIGDVDTKSIKSYSWKPHTDIHLDIDDGATDKPVISFTAPYVKGASLSTQGNRLNTQGLSFTLTVTDKDSKTRSSIFNVDIIVKRVHRAIIFQGGAALGAYEAGVYKAIVEKLVKNDEDRERKGLINEKRPLFDIVAGTSIGAMNSAIIVRSVTKDNDGKSVEDPENWQHSVEKVIEFWSVQKQFPTFADFLDMNPFYRSWWDILHNTSTVIKHSASELIELYSNMNPTLKSYIDMLTICLLMDPNIWKDYFIDGWYIPATAEAMRRYYSAWMLHRTYPGPFHVATGIQLPWWSAFGKFFHFTEQSNWMPRPDNKHFLLFSLKQTLEQFMTDSIKTSPKEPRLLLVTVDVITGDSVTFDSYSEKARYHGDEKRTISSPEGIKIEHALASGTFPNFFDYPKFKVMEDKKSEERIFWDGGYRSNTPLREVIQAHRDYWLRRAKDEHQDQEDYEYEDDVPDLEIYIADLWPSELKENPISFDKDFVENRKLDLTLGDKTDYDEQVANFVTDYVNLARRLKNLAIQKGASKEVDDILNSPAISIDTKGKTRKNRDLLQGRFRIRKVVHIDRKDDGNEIHDKVFDYSYKTVEELMKTGYHDAILQIDIQQVKDGVIELATRNGGWDNVYIQDIEESLNQIEEMIKTEDDNNGTIIKEKIKGFMDKVDKMGEVLPKERFPLIAATKQLQDTLSIL
jgi:NTE family protein